MIPTSVFPPHTRRSWDRLHIGRIPDPVPKEPPDDKWRILESVLQKHSMFIDTV